MIHARQDLVAVNQDHALQRHAVLHSASQDILMADSAAINWPGMPSSGMSSLEAEGSLSLL